MILGKLAKTGALVASGILIGGLLSYNSEKTKIINGIDYLKNNKNNKKALLTFTVGNVFLYLYLFA